MFLYWYKNGATLSFLDSQLVGEVDGSELWDGLVLGTVLEITNGLELGPEVGCIVGNLLGAWEG